MLYRIEHSKGFFHPLTSRKELHHSTTAAELSNVDLKPIS